MLIWNYYNMTAIIWPPLTSNKNRDQIVFIYNVFRPYRFFINDFSIDRVAKRTNIMFGCAIVHFKAVHRAQGHKLHFFPELLHKYLLNQLEFLQVLHLDKSSQDLRYLKVV